MVRLATLTHHLELKRRLSLDVFRGLTVAAMILVNSPGNKTAYPPLDHADWHGLTFTDLVFPFFMFIVGMSLVLSLSRRLAAGVSRESLMAVVSKRAVILIGLGLLLSAFPFYDLVTLRFPGVLQRIALGYFFGSLLFLYTTRRTQILIALAILIGYWLAMTQIPVPGFDAGDLTREENLAAWIDRWVFGRHLYRPAYDPEGLLSTLPAIVTVLFGMWACEWKSVCKLLMAGVLLGISGVLWAQVFPINKALWTSSYVLVTAGWAVGVYAILVWVIDQKGWSRWSGPFVALGQNAIAAFLLHIMFLKIQNRIPVALSDGTTVNLRLWLTDHLLFARLPSETASLAYALTYTALWILFFVWLSRRRIVIKI